MAHSPSSLRDRVLAAAAATPSITRPQGHRIAVALVAASIAIGVTVFEAIGGLGHSSGRPIGMTLALAGGWVLVSLALTWLLIGRGSSTLARRSTILVTAALASPLAVFLWMHVFYGTYPEPFARVGYRCLAYTLVIAATPLAAFLALRRAVEPRHPGALGAVAGAACAAWAGALVDLWCPLTNPLHVLVGHVGPLVVAILAGAAAGRWTLGVRWIGRGPE
jgi:hypothetical protein